MRRPTRPLAALAAAILGLPAVAAAQSGAAPRTGGAASRYAVADALADSAPPDAERSVAELAGYLARAGGDDLTRARALYRWVAGHITYDVEGFRSGRPGDPSPEAVLERRTSVCEGFAQLTQALGRAMGLEVQVVSGWSKGYGYTPGQRFEGPTNHAWDAVRIDGTWRLMDPTWGAGYLDESLRFVRRFQDHYFLTEPGEFVFDHLPQDSSWQLLDRPLTAAEYADLVYLRPMFFEAGFRIGNRDRLVLDADGPLTVTLGLTQPEQMTAQVLDASTQRQVDGEFAFVQVDSGEARIDARFPRRGSYLLRVFAKPLGAAGPLEWILDYRVRAGGAPGAVFPTAFEAFGVRGVRLLGPLDGVLRAGRAYTFALRAPGALEVAVVAGGRWTRLVPQGDGFAGEATAEPGTVTVFARYDTTGEYEGLLRYTGR
ncbi:MAG TPA: transglutaminase domain-containing protein [Gemmatimonadales bacterium]|nr:transglutaminase domain-containing protein [Gemmatimonadales bacterium]